VADSSCTISGPPSTLALLFASSKTLANAVRVKLPITAAFHARHLGKPNTAKIVGSSSLFGVGLKHNLQILSTGSAEPFIAESLADLLHQIIDDVLEFPLIWSKTVQAVISDLETPDVTITTFGPTNVSKSLRRALESAGLKVTETGEISPSPQHKIRGGSGHIAVVGMSGRFPGGGDLEEFWKEVLEKGRDMCSKVNNQPKFHAAPINTTLQIPKDRFSVDTHCDPSGSIKNTISTPFGCFVDRPGFFDARLFNMSPREAMQTDPIHRLILMTTYEALEQAGYSPDGTMSTTGPRIGTYFGQTTDDYRDCNGAQNIDLYYVSGGIRAFGPGRLNYHFKWEGPSYSLDTACSSSSACIEFACKALLNRDIDTAIAGGGAIISGSDMFSGLSRGGFLSPTGSCKTFDDGADGYCRADAVGAVVLKRLEDAIADNDNIKAVITGVATNHSAHAVSITHPHAGAQKRLYERVLQEACVEPSEISYIEMHGTGTQAGDATEMESVTQTFGNGRKRDNPLYVGAVKANVGHSEAAAGITSVIKAALMFEKNVVPPHAGIKGRLNHKFPDLDAMNIHIARSKKEFRRHSHGDGKRKILINNFNATGGNTSLLLEEPPKREIYGKDPRSAHVVAISARTVTSLKQNKLKLLEYLNSNPQTYIADLAYTTTARRMHHVFRTAHAVTSAKELIGVLTQDLASGKEPERTSDSLSVVFTFTGQGAQYPGMGKQLFETNAKFRDTMTDFDAICRRMDLPSFLTIITDNNMNVSSMTPVQTQLAIVALELALAQFWQFCGLKPSVVIGHSLGEYAALCVARVISVSDMFFLVGRRAQIMEKMCTKNSHSMLAIQATSESVARTLLNAQLHSCEIACVNGPTSTVVSGTVADINRLKEILQPEGTKSTVLEVPFAFHSQQMDPILNEYEICAQNVQFKKPVIPIASTLQGEVITTEGTFSPKYLTRQARHKVEFLGALRACKSSGIIDDNTLWVESGPGSVCMGLVRSSLDIHPSKLLPSMKHNEDCWKLISKSLCNAYNAGSSLKWPDFHREYQSALTLLNLPTYAFDLKDYWIPYEGNWLLTKGDKTAIPEIPSFSTTCLQRVESETIDKESASVTFVSSAAEPNLFAAIQGHLVNGVGLCPSSVYSDMAFTAASYLHTKMEPANPVPAMDVSKMEVFHPLVVLPNHPNQIIRVKATRSSNSSSTEVYFSSQDGGEPHDHAHCTVHYGNGSEWKDEWARNSYLVNGRIDSLMEQSKVGTAHKMLRKLIYKLFSTLVAYDEKYHGLEEVYMDSDRNEASATVKFQSNAENGTFTYSPYWIDSIVHLAGFVLNGNVNTPEDAVYISHGWKSLRIAAPLSEHVSYKSYVRMQPVGGRGVYAGDVYIFEGDEVIAVCTGLKFQEIKKHVLHALLPGSSKMGTQTKEMVKVTSQSTVAPKATPKAKVAARKTKTAAVVLKTSGPSFTAILETIAGEVGLGINEFTDSANFGDLGVDSLLTISIMSALRAQTGQDLPISIFTTYPTVAELRAYFKDTFGYGAEAAQEPEEEETASSSEEYTSDVDAPFSRDNGSMRSSVSSISAPDSVDVADIFISAVASETGVDASEMTNSTLWSDLGVDSLMSIAVLSAVKDQAGMLLPAAFFTDNPTVADVRKALGSPSKPAPPPPAPVVAAKPPKASSKPTPSSQALTTKITSPLDPKYKSNVVFLSGNPQATNLPVFFLIADGAGSAASYISFPPFANALPTYALESPFLHCPLEYSCKFEDVAAIYVDTIRKIRPHGPYILGGWSLGGIHAYEVCRQLTDLGEKVLGIVMVDSPCPKALPHMPEPTIELMEATGVFIGIKRAGKPDTPMPLKTKQHLVSCVKALKVYEAIPLSPEKRPGQTFIIWAKDGVFENMQDKIKELADEKNKEYIKEEEKRAQAPGAEDENVGLKKDWLTSERKSFGPNGWDRLLGSVDTTAIDGDHFSVMNQPKVCLPFPHSDAKMEANDEQVKYTGMLVAQAVQRFLMLR
jgi:iterative type I PKS product template protein